MSLRDLRRHVGQLAILGFPGHDVPDDLARVAAAFDLGGVIYFARNVAEPAQVADLSRQVAALRRETPLWISVDQEGGRVARLRAPFTEWPPLQTIGRAGRGGDERLVEAFAAALAVELRAVGINLDFTPVLDILTNPANPVIGDRSFGATPDVVARLGSAMVRTLHAHGVMACGKHFPGHGDTSVDSHLALPVVEHPPERLRAVEFVPFQAAMETGLDVIMTAHVLVPAVDADRPATLSRRLVTDVLKGDLGFDGVVMSDDMGMQAVAATWPLPEATVHALAAGCDVVLLCNSTIDEQVATLEAVIHAVEQGTLPQSRVQDALARQARVKATHAVRLQPPVIDLSGVGRDDHHAVAARMAALL